MDRIRNRRSFLRTKWPWKKFFPPKVDERFCEQCGLLHQDGPMPKRIDSFPSGSIEVSVYPSGTWKRDELTLSIGRCRATRTRLYLGHYFSVEELDDVIRAAYFGRQYIKAKKDRLLNQPPIRRARRVK